MIFFDNASTTKPYDEIGEIVKQYNMDFYYNPSAIYSSAFEIQTKLKNAKINILKALGARDGDEFLFTSCATESNNMVLRAFAKKNGKILVTNGEHPAVFNTATDLKNTGYNVDFINLKPSGQVDEEDLLKKLTPDVNLVSLIHVNNETGAINDIAKLVRLIKSKNPRCLVHSDGVQAFGKIAVNVTSLGVDFYTISGHKIHAPKGIAGLYIAGGKYIKPLITGGEQQGGLRSGTENVSGIMSLEYASVLAKKNLQSNMEKVAKFRDILLDGLDKNLPYKVVGSCEKSPYVNMIICAGCRAETLVHMMEDRGFLIGNGSACSSKKRDNRNLKQLGYTPAEIEGAIRISFSEFNTEEEVFALVKNLNECVNTYLQKVR